MGEEFVIVGTRPLGARTPSRHKFVFGCLNAADDGLDRVADAADTFIIFNINTVFAAVASAKFGMGLSARARHTQRVSGGGAQLLI